MATQIPQTRTHEIKAPPPGEGEVLQGEIGEYGLILKGRRKPFWFEAHNDDEALKTAAGLLGINYPFTLAHFEGRGASEVHRRYPYVKIYPKETEHRVRAGIAVFAASLRRLLGR